MYAQLIEHRHQHYGDDHPNGDVLGEIVHFDSLNRAHAHYI
jgi:hypothetical protein